MNTLIYGISFVLLAFAGLFGAEDTIDIAQDTGIPEDSKELVMVPQIDEQAEVETIDKEEEVKQTDPEEVPVFVPVPEVTPVVQPDTSKKITPPIVTPEPVPIADTLEEPLTDQGGLRSFIFGDDDESNNNDLRLTPAGVLLFTNAERVKEGRSQLTQNSTLDRMAKAKLDDMFAQDYFEHDNPQGVGVSDLADSIGYAYLLIGENLALGEFKDNKHLVQSWMESPGHRANILNKKYAEIGIAVGKGEYEGKTTWMAVQEFGLPRDVCPFPSEQLRVRVEAASTALTVTKSQVDARRAELERMSPGDTGYRTTVDTFNSLVNDYNTQVTEQKSDIARYNIEVNNYNVCIEEKS